MAIISKEMKYDWSSMRRAVIPFQTGYRPSYTYESIKSAILQHQRGYFEASSQLLEKMYEDSELPGTIEKRVNTTLKADFRIDHPDEDLSFELKQGFQNICPYGELFSFMRNFVVLGVAIGYIHWEQYPDRWIPKFCNLPTQFLRYDESLRCYKYIAQGGEEIVVPGDGRWVLMVKSNRSFTDGLIRSLATLWLMKAFNMLSWARHNEIHGNPIFLLKIPFSVGAKDKDDFIDSVSTIGSDGVFGLPTGMGDDGKTGFDMSLLEATSKTWETFKVFNEMVDRKFQVALLGNNIGTEVASTGSNRAAAESAAKGLDALKGVVDAQILGETIQKQILQPYIWANYGNIEIPFPVWDLADKEDLSYKASSIKSLADAITSLKSAGKKLSDVSLKALCEEYGIDLEDLEEGEPEEPPVDPIVPEEEPYEEAAAE